MLGLIVYTVSTFGIICLFNRFCNEENFNRETLIEEYHKNNMQIKSEKKKPSYYH
jgi:hypothetical protein